MLGSVPTPPAFLKGKVNAILSCQNNGETCWGDLVPAGRIIRQQLTPPEARLVNQLLFEIGDLAENWRGTKKLVVPLISAPNRR